MSPISLGIGLLNDDKLRNANRMGSLLWPLQQEVINTFLGYSDLPLLDPRPPSFITSAPTAWTLLAASLAPGHLCFMLEYNCQAEVWGSANSRIITAAIQKGFPRLPVLGFPSPSSRSGSPGGNVSEQRFCRLKIHDQVFKIAVTRHPAATCFVLRNHLGAKHTLLSFFFLPPVRTQKSNPLNQISELGNTLPA